MVIATVNCTFYNYIFQLVIIGFRNNIDFYMLILYLVNLVTLINSSKFIDCLGYSI